MSPTPTTNPAGPAAAPADLLAGAGARDVHVDRGGRGGLVGAAVLVVAVLVLALWVPYNVSLGTLSQLVGLFALIILATTWNLLAGYGGLVSIGQQAFIGAGGYGVIYLADTVGVPLIGALALAAVVCGLLALMTSFLVFRLVGGYFAIGTWVVAEVFKLVTTQVDALGGGSGLSLGAFRGVDRVDRVATVYWLGLGLAVLVVVATYLLMRSRVGLGLTAIRDDAKAASGLGVDVRRWQRTVYVASSAGAGLAGALIAVNTLRVSPDSIYSVSWSAFMIFIVVIGGLGTIEGPILGAVVFFVLQQQLADQGTWYLVAVGALAIAVVLLAPRGLWGALTRDRLHLFPVGRRVRVAERSGRPAADA
ncbi:branched-chain amino acid ABC transporter permease [Nocardioides marmotae]|uniref:Branched-chain amino acid ABC transporter permease n=1 Tax=Nocardioides marmotae TaxID=2663857 RepID=A0A6I3JEA1_9ACTN|nr:branched-chain amino acid ABC transporter permease [Nocardioides marmotae]MCR6032820.1 branched-chain amino acid ABC transporter permease [Gordonia jinghuaiqii]MBC9735176.1 branched-chain amino acid ABC transporter permease [Nocardioides marmotae]MTB86276.1 branched-chain amino acid ABC transporter permease [Nocardioides marmotae]MTB96470.1 branched-chain amino acid ABC transporter permease [Nocardioides marmotae]QKE02006.1 branched-chain amino acid ABC transporter permease [Nocardioides ma